jgi:HPt (histidine-containing phosphotransfer) domain-containing protein
MSDAIVFDPSALDRMREDTGGEAEFVVEMIDEFLANAEQLIISLRAALPGDSDAGRAAAHALKGNSAAFGAVELTRHAAILEASCKAGELSAWRQQLEAVVTAMDAARAALTAAGDRLRAEVAE